MVTIHCAHHAGPGGLDGQDALTCWDKEQPTTTDSSTQQKKVQTNSKTLRFAAHRALPSRTTDEMKPLMPARMQPQTTMQAASLGTTLKQTNKQTHQGHGSPPPCPSAAQAAHQRRAAWLSQACTPRQKAGAQSWMCPSLSATRCQ